MGLSNIYEAVLFIVIISAVAVTSKEQLSTRECEDLGFTGLALCSDCNTFAEYVKDQELVADCLKCCTEDSDDSMSKITYSGAILEACMRKLVFYPEIVGFIEEEKDKFPTVRVQYVFNSPPKLIMLDEEGQHKETIRIDNWKREHMLQFLQEKVITYSGAILEACMRKLVFYHEIVGFIEEEKDKFPTVKSSIFFNSPPQLVVLAQEGQHKETISIDNWKREHMLQFLEEKVKPTSAKI